MMQQIDLLNNKGVMLLQNGSTLEACSMFSKASSMIGQSIHRSSQQPGTRRQLHSSCKWVALSTGSDLLDARGSPLFLRAVITTDIMSSENLTWAVLYNLALSCHLHACMLGANGDQYLERAHQLYDLIRNRFIDEVEYDHAVTLSLAVYNNMGCIYQEFAMHDEARRCCVKAHDMLFVLSSGKCRPDGMEDIGRWSVNLATSFSFPAAAA